MLSREANSKTSVLVDIGIVLIVINLLIPVSNTPNTINSDMALFASEMLGIIVFYLNILSQIGKMGKKQLYCNIAYIALLGIFSFLTFIFNPDLEFKSGELLRYITLFLLLNVRIQKSHFKFTIYMYTSISLLIIGVGILEAMGNQTINEFLRTYYVNHYAHIYTVMIQANKTVTFFATHSISAYIYLLLFMGWEFYSITHKSKLSVVCRVGLLFVIIFCKSMSAILCLGIVVIYYLVKYKKEITKKHIFIFSALLIAGIIWLFNNFSIIEALFLSKKNGVLGRYFGGLANLGGSIRYILNFGLPTGFYNLGNLRYNDSGYVVYILRGGIGILIVIDVMLFRLLKQTFEVVIIYKTLFFCVLLFDTGYAILMNQRFVAAFILVIYFIASCCLPPKSELKRKV